MKQKCKKKSIFREWIESIIIAACLAIFVRTFFFQIYKIPTTSMVPTLTPKDKIFVSKLTYGPRIPFTSIRIRGFREPKRGDVVVFVPPNEVGNFWPKRKVYIKRLIGVSGDKIAIRGGSIYVNGEKVNDSAITKNYYYNQGGYGAEEETIEVPEGKYFFLGDNSRSSLDSRFWGFADGEYIVGKAVFIWWPIKRIGMIR